MSEDGPVEEVFQSSIEPLLDFTGNMEKTRQFLDDLKIKGNVESLARDDLARLCTALTLKLLMQGSFAADSIIGEVIRLKHEVVENSLEMVQLLNACGNRDVPGLGLTLCLRDTSALEQAKSLGQEYKGHILREIGMLREQNKVLKNIRYLKMVNMEAGAIVSGLGIRYLYADLPLITLNHKDDMVKISARGTKPLISRGLDLSIALRKAAEAVGGMGGGHTIASGASIPPGTEDRFLALLDEIVGEQLHKDAEDDTRPCRGCGMIRARLIFWGMQAEPVARAIEPDNLPNMSLQIDADRLCLQFSTEKIGTLLSTVDDLLMNIKIAEETLTCTEER